MSLGIHHRNSVVFPLAMYRRGRAPDRYGSQFENNYFTEMCSGFEVGSYLRLIDFVYHSTLGLRVIKKEKKDRSWSHSPLPKIDEGGF